LIRSGVPGVLVCQCPARDCEGREGPKWLHERMHEDREAELKARVDRRRIRVVTVAPGTLAETTAAFDSFARELTAMHGPDAESNPELELECEAEPADEVAS